MRQRCPRALPAFFLFSERFTLDTENTMNEIIIQPDGSRTICGEEAHKMANSPEWANIAAQIEHERFFVFEGQILKAVQSTIRGAHSYLNPDRVLVYYHAPADVNPHNEEMTATEALLRMYGWKEDESLQMFLHRTRHPADPLKHSPEYMRKLLQECERELAKATAALKTIFDCTDPYADGVIDASAHDKLCNEISALARPWARTHSPNGQADTRHE